jgi:biopolymer transport protein ExbB/TolQ
MLGSLVMAVLLLLVLLGLELNHRRSSRVSSRLVAGSSDVVDYDDVRLREQLRLLAQMDQPTVNLADGTLPTGAHGARQLHPAEATPTVIALPSDRWSGQERKSA